MKYIAILVLLISWISAQAEGEPEDSFSKSTDKRCQFFYSTKQYSITPLLKRANVSEKDYYAEDSKADKWLDAIFDGSPYVRKSAKAPKFVFGRLYPYVDEKDKSTIKVRGVSVHNIFRLNETEVVFPSNKSVPCGFVLVYPIKWQVKNGFLEISQAKFAPEKMP